LPTQLLWHRASCAIILKHSRCGSPRTGDLANYSEIRRRLSGSPNGQSTGYHITFEPRTTIKSQVLADFIVDWTGPITQPDTPAEKVWTIHYDGAWCHAGAGVAAIITSPTGVKHRYATRLSFALESDRCTNNVAEYETVILGLRKLRALGVTTCIIKTDSKVVVG
jgi:hypothetical protein